MSQNSKINIDISLVRKLIATQFPEWVDLPIIPVEFSGWDNRTFHLGDHMIIRLPSEECYAEQVVKEMYWLPKLALHLPLSIPAPLAIGNPGEGYPWNWSIYKWLDGETASMAFITDMNEFAKSLAAFLTALQKIDSKGGPVAGKHNFYRGGLLSIYDNETRQAIDILRDQIDVDTVIAIWSEAMATTWQLPPVWVHGDVAEGNLLVDKGKLCAVIDFGCLGIGDPACDLVITWTFFKGEARAIFREAVLLDNATWARARGWALWKALFVCAGLSGADPQQVGKSWSILREVIADYKGNL